MGDGYYAASLSLHTCLTSHLLTSHSVDLAFFGLDGELNMKVSDRSTRLWTNIPEGMLALGGTDLLDQIRSDQFC